MRSSYICLKGGSAPLEGEGSVVYGVIPHPHYLQFFIICYYCIMVDWMEEIDWCIAKATSDRVLDADQVTRYKEYTTVELFENAEASAVQKLKEVIHCNILDAVPAEDRAKVLIKNLESKHSYKSTGSSMPNVTINIPTNLLPAECGNVRAIEGGSDER